MSERKVLNKYYPPDFDPAKIPRKKQLKNLQMKVRMMLPMSIRCNTCGNYIYKGTKFNCRKEDVIGDTYLGIMKFRFYFKCTKCSAELIMKTDPQNSDYTMESGASRNFEPWRQVDEQLDEAKKERDAEEMGDAMKALENRTMDSKQEMDIMAALDEMKSMRARQQGVGTEDMLEALNGKLEQQEQEQAQVLAYELTENDEKIVKSVVFRNSSKYVHRISDEDDDEDRELAGLGIGAKKAKISVDSKAAPTDLLASSAMAAVGPPASSVIIRVKPKVSAAAVTAVKVVDSEPKAPASANLSSLLAYSDNSSGED